jgi:hypothetical protein
MVALLGRDGRPGQLLDLSERDGKGAYRRSVATSEDPTRYGLQPSGLLVHVPAR